MTGAVALPRRKWAKDEPAPVTTRIVTSSRDGAPVPDVPAALRLAKAAEAAGWQVRYTYALAEVGVEFYLNGRLRKPGHTLATVAVRLIRRTPGVVGAEFAIAIWCRENEGGWRFRSAWFCGEQLGARAIAERVTTLVGEKR